MKRIHKEPGHEKDANTQEDYCQVWKHCWVDRTDVATHGIQAQILQIDITIISQQCNNNSNNDNIFIYRR